MQELSVHELSEVSDVAGAGGLAVGVGLFTLAGLGLGLAVAYGCDFKINLKEMSISMSCKK
ncbi:hypothetical protein BURK2_03216 [Burkholderiales bacterium]|nr:hypothetical protein BURK2_03216 [Burkholderiales bacterium]